jgi:hypothetical protein
MHCSRWLLVIAVLMVAPYVWSQDIGPEAYSFVHPFGLSTATTARQYGMGGTVSCINESGFANPAYAACQSGPAAGVRINSTEFDFGPRVTSVHAHCAVPTKPNEQGWQFNVFSLDSYGGSGMAGPQLDISEDDLAVHFGQRLSRKLVAGVGLSPYSKIRFSVNAPTGTPLMAVKSESDMGARLGLAYEWVPGDFIGFVGDYYQETASVAGFGDVVFHTTLLAAGASRHLGDNLLVAAEFQRGSSKSGAVEDTLNGWHFGAEYKPAGHLAFRGGLNDTEPTFGIGFDDGRWAVDYAYIKNWNSDIARDLLGDSATHSVHATYRW